MRLRQDADLPLDLYSTVGSEWMCAAYWPVSYDDTRARLVKLLWSVETDLSNVEKDIADIVTLAAPTCVHWACAVVEATVLAHKSMSGMATTGSHSLFDFIVGRVEDIDAASLTVPKSERAMGSIESFARSAVRSLTWSTARTALKAMFAPSAVAIAHNPVLQEYALHSDFGIAFRRGDDILRRHASAGRADPDLTRRATEWFLVRLQPGLDDMPKVVERAAILLRRGVEALVTRAQSDLEALKGVSLPSVVWSGSGSKWSSRAIGLTVLRRGGEAWRFDHGGGVGLVHDPKSFNLMELCVSSAYVANTSAAKAIYQDDLMKGMKTDCEIMAGVGDPTFRSVVRRRRTRSARPRVLYVTTIFRGIRQFHPPFLPDPLYLLWQNQIASALAEWKLDLVLKPAPEGLLLGKSHPLASNYTTSTALFEEELDNCDVAVFDYAHTTTFWKAMSSGIAVVLLDLGNNAIGDVVRERLIRSGCAIINATYDERGVPGINLAELREAVLRECATSPEDFRAICAG